MGDNLADNGDLEEIQEKLSSVIKEMEIEAIDNSIVITPNCSENIHVALQATGLSGLRPNTYCLNCDHSKLLREYSCGPSSNWSIWSSSKYLLSQFRSLQIAPRIFMWPFKQLVYLVFVQILIVSI